ncbi:hypothetical protein P7K49_027625 [Saguinus oedipus]|uniref:Uncharacterized protein n=1 Tax=Saguinus oedipus TaxID=9490 RepID=A0ABQ9U9Z5_SAGOE|nr:hypothetical protein P7K49_027625 [Saguinus oedipus]
MSVEGRWPNTHGPLVRSVPRSLLAAATSLPMGHYRKAVVRNFHWLAIANLGDCPLGELQILGETV